MFIRNAWADAPVVAPDAASAAANAAVMPGLWGQLAPLVLIFIVFYFLLIRPQQKKLKNHIDMVAALRRGDKVVTGGGIVGTITRLIDDKEVSVEIADGVEIKVIRSSIAEVISKSPVSASDAKGKAA